MTVFLHRTDNVYLWQLCDIRMFLSSFIESLSSYWSLSVYVTRETNASTGGSAVCPLSQFCPWEHDETSTCTKLYGIGNLSVSQYAQYTYSLKNVIYFDCNSYIFYICLCLKKILYFSIIVEILRFLAIRHYIIIFAVKIYISVTTHGLGSDCGMVGITPYHNQMCITHQYPCVSHHTTIRSAKSVNFET